MILLPEKQSKNQNFRQMMSKFSYFKDVKTKKLFHTSAKSKNSL